MDKESLKSKVVDSVDSKEDSKPLPVDKSKKAKEDSKPVNKSAVKSVSDVAPQADNGMAYTLENVERTIEPEYDDIRMAVMARMKLRVKDLQEQSRAKTKSYKMGGLIEHVTTAPKIHIQGLNPKIVGGVGTISYSVYLKGEDGNKAISVQEFYDEDKKRNVTVNAQPIIESQIVETIESGKKIKQNIMQKRMKGDN